MLTNISGNNGLEYEKARKRWRKDVCSCRSRVQSALRGVTSSIWNGPFELLKLRVVETSMCNDGVIDRGTIDGAW